MDERVALMRRPTRVAVVLALAALAAMTVSGAGAYWWTWPTYPYQKDDFGNYAYRDMEFSWGTWSAGSSFFYGVYVYVHISSPTAGYIYESYGGAVMSDGGGNRWGSGSTYVDYYSGLTYMSVPFQGGGAAGTASEVAVWTAICEHNGCAFFNLAPNDGSNMWAIVPYQGTTAYCASSFDPGAPSRWYPDTYWC